MEMVMDMDMDMDAMAITGASFNARPSAQKTTHSQNEMKMTKED